MIDAKKRNTYENGSRSKILSVYVIESETKEVDEILCLMKSPRFKYVSYRNSTSKDRLAAMYYNDMKNGKGKYETLENENLKVKVLVKVKN